MVILRFTLQLKPDINMGIVSKNAIPFFITKTNVNDLFKHPDIETW